MHNIGISIRTVAVVGTFLFSVACSNSSSSQGLSDYDKLCNIYEEATQKPVSPLEKITEINDRVKKEIPDVYIHFKNIASANPNDAYRLFKKVAEAEIKKPWDCDAMKEFYSKKSNKD